MIARRPDSDLQKAAEVLTELETLEYGKATTRHLDDIFGLLVILDPDAEQSVMMIQSRVRGNKLRKDMLSTGGDLYEAHRKQEQYQVLKQQIEAYEATKKKLLHRDKTIFSHPIFVQNIYIKGIDLTVEEVFQFKKIYAMADIAHIGYLGRKQFAHLLEILKIETTDDMLEDMFREMDENNDVSAPWLHRYACHHHHLCSLPSIGPARGPGSRRACVSQWWPNGAGPN